MERIKKLQAMLEQQPGDGFLQHALALEYVKLGDDDSAGLVFKALLERDPGYVGSYYHYASLLARKGHKAEALTICEQGLEACKRGGDDHAWRELNTIYEDLLY